MMRLGLFKDVVKENTDLDEMNIVAKCPICPLSKNHRLPFSLTRPRASNFLENVHVDLSGIIRTTGLNREEYFIMFTDDYSSFRTTYGIPDKSAETVYECFMKYMAYAERQTGQRLKRFTLDGGGEFINLLLSPRLEELGIITRVTAPYTAEQNGVSERGNRTINTKARCMMVQSGSHVKYLYHAVKYAVLLQNRLITTALDLKETPYHKWYGRQPHLKHLKPFGCLAYRHVRKVDRHGKFNAVSHMGVLLGVSDENHNYEILDMETNKIYISHDVTFQPMVFLLRKNSENQMNWDFINDDGLALEEGEIEHPE